MSTIRVVIGLKYSITQLKLGAIGGPINCVGMPNPMNPIPMVRASTRFYQPHKPP
nr:hypothetical protein [Coxiella endosymbiont of Ornithodoros maritimus]